VAITHNVPLNNIVNWLVDLAPTGVIEFVPKDDPMVQDLLKLRKDIFQDYTEEHFTKCLMARATIIKTITISSSTRKLFWYVNY
jgi:hypothetical protein